MDKGVADKSARAATASPPSPSVSGQAGIANAEEMLEAAYKDGYFAGAKDPDVENVTAMFLHSETARACRARRDIAEIQRLRMFLITIMVNCEKIPKFTKDDIQSLCSDALKGKSIQESALEIGATKLGAGRQDAPETTQVQP